MTHKKPYPHIWGQAIGASSLELGRDVERGIEGAVVLCATSGCKFVWSSKLKTHRLPGGTEASCAQPRSAFSEAQTTSTAFQLLPNHVVGSP